MNEENFTADDLLVAYHNGLNEGYKILSDKIREEINKLKNDIQKTKDIYHKGVTSYGRCRLKAYITKSNEVINRLEKLLKEV